MREGGRSKGCEGEEREEVKEGEGRELKEERGEEGKGREVNKEKEVGEEGERREVKEEIGKRGQEELGKVRRKQGVGGGGKGGDTISCPTRGRYGRSIQGLVCVKERDTSICYGPHSHTPIVIDMSITLPHPPPASIPATC